MFARDVVVCPASLTLEVSVTAYTSVDSVSVSYFSLSGEIVCSISLSLTLVKFETALISLSLLLLSTVQYTVSVASVGAFSLVTSVVSSGDSVSCLVTVKTSFRINQTFRLTHYLLSLIHILVGVFM